MKAVLIPCDPDKAIEDIELPDNQSDAADRVRELIGGYFQLIKVRNEPRLCLWCDEDGKLSVKPVNLRATFFSVVEPPDFIVGDVVLTGGRGAIRPCPLEAWEVKNRIMGAIQPEDAA